MSLYRYFLRRSALVAILLADRSVNFWEVAVENFGEVEEISSVMICGENSGSIARLRPVQSEAASGIYWRAASFTGGAEPGSGGGFPQTPR
jgi:hypothetical protein